MSDKIIDVNEDNFKEEVLNSELPVLVDFWAPWCAPCTALKPIIEDLAKDYQEEIKVVKVNIDHNNQLAQKYDVKGIPNLKFFSDGEKVAQKLGFSSYDDLEDTIKGII